MQLVNTLSNKQVRDNVIKLHTNSLPIFFTSALDSNNSFFITEVSTNTANRLERQFTITASYILDCDVENCRLPIASIVLNYEYISLNNGSCSCRIENISSPAIMQADPKILKAMLAHAENFSRMLYAKKLHIVAKASNNDNKHPKLLTKDILTELGYKPYSSVDITADGIQLMTKDLKSGQIKNKQDYTKLNDDDENKM